MPECNGYCSKLSAQLDQCEGEKRELQRRLSQASSVAETTIREVAAELEAEREKVLQLAKDNLELTSGSLNIDPETFKLARQAIAGWNKMLADKKRAEATLDELRRAAGWNPELGLRIVPAGLTDAELVEYPLEQLRLEYVAIRDCVNAMRKMLDPKEVDGG
jgi:hypothetical protein